jgi:hypothetical protein
MADTFDTFEGYATEASLEASALDQATQAAQAASWLSAEGKAAKIAAAQAKYAGAIADIKTRAEADLSEERSTIEANILKLKAAQAKAEREVVGPEIAFRLIERRLSSATAQQLVEEVRAARDPWERAVIGRLAGLFIPEPTSTEDHATIHLRSELAAPLREAPDPAAVKLEGELARVAHDLGQLDRLDPQAWQRSLRQRFKL